MSLSRDHKEAPRQWSLQRKVSQNELPARCIRRTVRRARRMVIVSPVASSLTTWPSALKMVAGLGLTTLTSMIAVKRQNQGAIRERVRADRCERKHLGRGKYDGATGGQGIGGRTRRRADNQAVAPIARERLAIDVDIQLDEAGRDAAPDHDIVESGLIDQPSAGSGQ